MKRKHLLKEPKFQKNDKETAKVLNNFFSTIIQNLKIPQYKEQDPIFAFIKDPLMKTIVKYRAHPSIIVIKENCNLTAPFNFHLWIKKILKRNKKFESE